MQCNSMNPPALTVMSIFQGFQLHLPSQLVALFHGSTQKLDSNIPFAMTRPGKLTFAHCCYSLGDDRPSQTDKVKS